MLAFLLLACVTRAELHALEARVATLESAAAPPVAQRLPTESALLGQPAPPLDVATWYQGVGSIPAQGTVILAFFESWCPHCQAEAPHLQALESTWGPQGVHVIGLTKVNKTATEGAVREMAATNHWTFAYGKETEGKVTQAYGITGIPSAVVIRDGIVVWTGHPSKLTDALVGTLVRGNR